MVYNRSTLRYNGTLTAAQAVGGPLQLPMDCLVAGVTLVNASSHAGAPYISLAAGASVTLPVSFSNPARLSMGFSAQIYSDSF